MYPRVYWLVCHKFFSNQANLCCHKTFLLIINSFSKITQAKSKNPYLSLLESPKPILFFLSHFFFILSPFLQLISSIFFPKVKMAWKLENGVRRMEEKKKYLVVGDKSQPWDKDKESKLHLEVLTNLMEKLSFCPLRIDPMRCAQIK
ncbi:Uncharacterized protein TCM_009123 [Theobroma cacao]|uniref:Uncharacterized protein n=1 Tax=Theobroma cacao TaxID=3641 RepID=A0A061E4L6_THECC|nr:Uncharacterized protein TCM_009123 [Theobroma cacao]